MDRRGAWTRIGGSGGEPQSSVGGVGPGRGAGGGSGAGGVVGVSAAVLLGACSTRDAGQNTQEPQVGEASEAAGNVVCTTIERGVAGSVIDAYVSQDQPDTNYGVDMLNQLLYAGKFGQGMRMSL